MGEYWVVYMQVNGWGEYWLCICRLMAGGGGGTGYWLCRCRLMVGTGCVYAG